MKKIFTILTVAACINTNAQVCFTSTNYPVGNSNTTIICSDFNSDGKLDLVLAYYADNICLLLGDGLGGFGAALPIISQDSMYYRFISNDFNNDGKADLAMSKWSNSSIGYIDIFFGDGTGSFPTSNTFAVAPYPGIMYSDDFNGDSNPDLILVHNDQANQISVLLGDGIGNFSINADFSAGASMNSITSGDFNGDSKVDFAVTCNGNGGGPDSLWVFLGDGTGNFGTADKYLAGSSPYSVCSKDFNSDGYDDIAVANWNSKNISVFLSNGVSGTFYPAINYATGGSSNSIVSADFTGDGILDLAVSNLETASKSVSVLIGTGTGSFMPVNIFSGGSGSWGIVSGDFNEDGKPDLATSNHDSPNVSVLINVPAPNSAIGFSGLSTICSGQSTTLTASGATNYTWSSNTGASNLNDSVIVVTPLSSSTYSLVGNKNGCKDSAIISFTVVVPEVPNICMVTTDSASYYEYNIVYWDNTQYSNADSFIVYRKDAISMDYLRIGAVSKNSLSEFVDTAFSIGGPNGGNPKYSSWLYKLAIRDSCGNISEKSPYHQSMFVQKNGSNFSWNAYTVETGQTNPVTGYSFLRDDNNTGDWHILVNIIGLSTSDPDYLSYPNGNWRIDALGFNCSPNKAQTQLISHSNTTRPVEMGINQLILNNEQIVIYPNPTNGKFTITQTDNIKLIEVINLLGEIIYYSIPNNIQKTTEIDLTNVPKGIYFVKIDNGDKIHIEKVVLN